MLPLGFPHTVTKYLLDLLHSTLYLEDMNDIAWMDRSQEEFLNFIQIQGINNVSEVILRK
jgi:hypothetical protein